MPINCMLVICKVTRVSKLFQRNFYLPLLRPLSPKDALRRHILSGKNLLGQRIEHYIPVLEEYKERLQRRKYMVKGAGKKRQRKRPNRKYVTPIIDDNVENHGMLQGFLSRKSKGRGQCYTYHIPDKNCTLVIPHQMERAIRDRDILDVVVAQRSEKIVLKMKNGKKVTMFLAPWDDHNKIYRGEGWTKKEIEETHHHGKETMGLAKLFEAKESGVEEWELEMMRMASKRKTKHRAEHRPEFKELTNAVAETMDWEQFEEEAKQIVEEANDPVEDEPIPMEMKNMDLTKNVNEKLKNAGEEVLEMLPLMQDIPEVVRFMQDGEYTEIGEVSGVMINLPVTAKEVFVAGQMANGEDGEIFMPGQTVELEDGGSEYSPGITCLMDGEPQLVAGLVMGDDPKKPMFLPGDSTITETGELQFTETEDDRPREPTPEPEPEPEPEVEEVELEQEQDSEEEAEDLKPPPPPPPRRPKKEFIYERPKRREATEGVHRRERQPKKPLISLAQPEAEPMRQIQEIEPVLYDLSLPSFEKDTLLQEKERTEKLTEKTSKQEWAIEKKKREIREKAKKIIAAKPPPPKYEKLEPVRKTEKLTDFEKKIKSGEFFDVDYKKFLIKERRPRVNWLEPYEYQNTFDSVGISRHRVWKSVHRR